MRVVIVAKTRMGSGACVGALTFEGRSLRLIAADVETNPQFNLGYEIGEVWEVETIPDPQITPPHVENVIVTEKRRLAPMGGLDVFIENQMPASTGGVDVLFEGLAQHTQAGGMYIASRTGIPIRSTHFWRPDRPLTRDDDAKRIRYRYPTPDGGRTLTFVGFQEPIPEIPAGALLRVSLAHWWRPREKPESELRCYVQLSGWHLTERAKASPAAGKILAAPRPVSQEGLQEIDEPLHRIFGFREFRPLQREIIENILQKRDTLALMPTGSGKSLCYQLPAALFPGLTVVASPLISLMEDQVLQLREWGFPALYLNSTLDYMAYLDAVQKIKRGEVKLLYAAPETLLRPETMLLLENNQVDCLVIDEAHCISEWGHDFRPEYRQLAKLRARLPGAVTLAVTATATPRVREDIKQSLQIQDANTFISSFDRPNLTLTVREKINGLAQTRAFLDQYKGEAGLVYCSTRETVDTLATQLASLGYPALPYHAGMDDESRRANQHRFRYEEGLIVVATIAFGMGIDKPNVRFILHYNLPKNLESYYQQIGRAGRDGLPASCLLLYSYGDLATIRYFMPNDDPPRRRAEEQRLTRFLTYLETQTCRRKPLLAYFGEKYPNDHCPTCDNCLRSSAKLDAHETPSPEEKTHPVDLTAPAQKFLTTVQLTRERFGPTHIGDILRGSRTKKILSFQHDRLSTHGQGREYTREQWRYLASTFVQEGLLRRVAPFGNLEITPAGKEVLAGKVFFGESPGDALRYAAAAGPAPRHDPALFELLRACRQALAFERGVPPYVIFHDRTILEMATYYPHTPEELLQIYGVGSTKVEQYAANFLPVIRNYCAERGIVPSKPVVAPARIASSEGSLRTEYIREQYRKGTSVSALATDLQIKTGTILHHLQKAFEAGHQLSPAGLIATSTLSPENQRRVLDAFAEHGTAYLKPVFEALGESVSYDELRLWRLIYEIDRKSAA